MLFYIGCLDTFNPSGAESWNIAGEQGQYTE